MKETSITENTLQRKKNIMKGKKEGVWDWAIQAILITGVKGENCRGRKEKGHRRGRSKGGVAFKKTPDEQDESLWLLGKCGGDRKGISTRVGLSEDGRKSFGEKKEWHTRGEANCPHEAWLGRQSKRPNDLGKKGLARSRPQRRGGEETSWGERRGSDRHKPKGEQSWRATMARREDREKLQKNEG